MMHTMAALAGIEYEEREVQVALDTEADIKITYGTVGLDATPVQIESWKQYYRANCLPSYRPGYQTACILYEGHLRENGIDPSSLGTPTAPSPTLSTADPCAQSRSSLACYYYTQYKSRCLPTASTSRCSTYATQVTTAGYALPTAPDPAPAPAPLNPAPVPVSGAAVFSDGFESGLAAKWVETGEFDWRADRPDEGNIPSRPSSNRVAEADDCDIGCVLTMKGFLNLSGHSSATLEFWRYVDTSLDVGEYLRVQVHSNGRWATVYSWGGGIGDDDRWHKESYSLAGKLTDDFKVRFVAKMSSSSEEVAIDDVAVRGTLRASSDTAPPVVTVPADITRTAPSSAGVAVTYTATARDAVDGALTPTCAPASGSTFGVGTTTVRCTATDAARNTGSASFRVTVSTSDTVPPVITLPSDMTVAATSGAGAYITYTATARDAVDGSVAASCWPRSGDRFFVGDTRVTCRAWDSARNQARASFTVTVTPFAPAPAPGAVVLSEGFEGGLSRWVESGEPDWRTGPHEEYYNPDGTRAGTTDNKVATADDCDAGCTLTLARALDLSGRTGATLTFSRFVDRSIDSGEYLRVQAHKGGSWSTIYSWGGGSGDDDMWHHESYSLSSYLVSDFKVRFVAKMSSSGEEAAVDNVEVRATGGAPADTEAPAVTVPAGISRTSAAAVAVTYTPMPTARDAVDGAITPACEPASGSAFAVGTTTVRCTATDSAGNTGSASFTVTVTAPDTTAPVITAPSAMSFTATSAAGATVEYAVTASDAVDGSITPACEPASGSTFAVGTATVRCTATDSAGNTGRASFTVTVAPRPAPANQCPAPGPSGASGASSAAPCPGASPTAPTTVFEDGFESGLSKWREATKTSTAPAATVTYGDTSWRHGSPDDGNPPGHGSQNKVAKADSCTPALCILELKDPIDLSGQSAAILELWRYMDSSLPSDNQLAVHFHKGGSWNRAYVWGGESHKPGEWVKVTHGLVGHLVSDFKVRFVVKASDANKDFAIDGVKVTAAAAPVPAPQAPRDRTAPVITSPDSITVMTPSSASQTTPVVFAVSARDAVDGSVAVTCNPASGTQFSLGNTDVLCTASDAAGNSAKKTTAVTVTRPELATRDLTKIRGGSEVQVLRKDSLGILYPLNTQDAVVGLAVTRNSVPMILMASHVVDLPNKFGHTFGELRLASSQIVNPTVANAITDTTNAITGRTVSSDAALLAITNTSIAPDLNNIQDGGTTITISGYGGAAGLKGELAKIVGPNTKSSGVILHSNVTVAAPDLVLTGQVAAAYASESGDSGSPVLYTDDSGSTKFLGTHVARTFFYTYPHGLVVAQPGAAPADEREYQYAIFSTWESIKSDLSLSDPS